MIGAEGQRQTRSVIQYIADTPKWKSEKPYIIHDTELDPRDGVPASNIELEPHSTQIHDVRGNEHDFSLERNGFQYVSFLTSYAPGSQGSSKNAYCSVVSDLLRQQVKVDRVICYDLRVCIHIIRRSPPDSA